METKKCSKCGEVKSLSMFYGTHNSCKVCECEYYKSKRRNLVENEICFLFENNIYHKSFNNDGTKRLCIKCGLIDEVALFKNNFRCNECFAIAGRENSKKCRDNLTDARKKEIKKYRKEYQSNPEYKEKQAAIQRKWRNENKEEALKRSRQQYKKHGERFNAIKRERLKTDKEFRDKVHERGREYTKSGKRKALYWKNPEHHRAITKRNRPKYAGKSKETQKKWREANKELILSYSKNKVDKLQDCYLRMNIKRRELIPGKYITKELIQLEREQLKLFRATR